jgi:hypothetical protein
MSKMRFFNTESKVKRLKPLTTSGKELESSHNRRFSIFSRFLLMRLWRHFIFSLPVFPRAPVPVLRSSAMRNEVVCPRVILL